MQPVRKPFSNAERCRVCGREARHNCRNCGKMMCDLHWNFMASMCSSCALKKGPLEKSKAEGKAKHAAFVGSTCAVCSADAKNKCKSCGSTVCDTHFDAAQGICVMCRIRKKIEEQKGIS